MALDQRDYEEYQNYDEDFKIYLKTKAYWFHMWKRKKLAYFFKIVDIDFGLHPLTSEE